MRRRMPSRKGMSINGGDCTMWVRSSERVGLAKSHTGGNAPAWEGFCCVGIFGDLSDPMVPTLRGAL